VRGATAALLRAANAAHPARRAWAAFEAADVAAHAVNALGSVNADAAAWRLAQALLALAQLAAAIACDDPDDRDLRIIAALEARALRTVARGDVRWGHAAHARASTLAARRVHVWEARRERPVAVVLRVERCRATAAAVSAIGAALQGVALVAAATGDAPSLP